MGATDSLVELPDKVYFRIGEVAEHTGVKAYVLRFWEDEFLQLHPQKGKSGQRRYRRADVETVLRIKELLWDRKFTIAGAKEELRHGRDRDRTRVAGQQDLPMAGTDAPPPEHEDPTAQPPLPAPSGDRPERGGSEHLVARGELLAVRADLAALRAAVRDLLTRPL